MATLFSKVKASVRKYNSVIHWEKKAGRTFDAERNNVYNDLILAYKLYLQNDNQAKEHRKIWVDDKGFIYYNIEFDHMHVPIHENVQFKEFHLPKEGE